MKKDTIVSMAGFALAFFLMVAIDQIFPFRKTPALQS
jgi:hypothetical protein